MNSDIRIDVRFFSHPKTVRLQMKCGDAGVISLMKLWAWSALNRPDGNLFGMDCQDIEIAAKWFDRPGELYAALTDRKSRFLDGEEEQHTLHDWSQHNPWVAATENRSDRGRLHRLKATMPKVYELFEKAGVETISKEAYTEITTGKNPVRLAQGYLEGTLRGPQGDLKQTSEVDLSPGPTPTPTPAPAPVPTPNVYKQTNTNKGDETAKPVEKPQPSPRAVIGRLYCEAFEKVTVPSTIWPEIDKLIAEYPLEKIKDAFTTFMGSRGKTWKYLLGILNENGGEKKTTGERNDEPGRFGKGNDGYRIDVG